jgi:chitinase
MKSFLHLLFVVICSLQVSPAFAGDDFNPYFDLALNVHWDSHYKDLEPVDLVQLSQDNGVKNYRLAFLTDYGKCRAGWGSQAAYAVTDAWGKHLTDAMHAGNINFFVSFGGATGVDLSSTCTDAQLAAVYELVIQTYDPQGLDFDIENDTVKVAKVMTALKQIQAAHPKLLISFTLPTLPEGMLSAGQDVVNQAKAAGLNYSVNIMAMDYGSSYKDDMGAYATQAATSLFNFLKKLYPQKKDPAVWAMIEVTPMIGVNDVSVEEFTLANAKVLHDFAVEKAMGPLSMWNANRDYPCADKTANLNCSGDNLQTVPYEFAKSFNP